MKISILIMVNGILSLYALDPSPQSSEAKEGKSVYIPIPKPLNLYEEREIQKADHNISGHGGAVWLQKHSR